MLTRVLFKKPTLTRNLYHCDAEFIVDRLKALNILGKICENLYSTFNAKIAVFSNVCDDPWPDIAENSNVIINAEKSNVENIAG